MKRRTLPHPLRVSSVLLLLLLVTAPVSSIHGAGAAVEDRANGDRVREMVMHDVDVSDREVIDNFHGAIALRTRHVEIDTEPLVKALAEDPVVDLGIVPFDGVSLAIAPSRPISDEMSHNLGGPVFSGGKQIGTATLTIFRTGNVYATIVAGDSLFTIYFVGDGVHVVREIDEGSLPSTPDEPVSPPGPPPESPLAPVTKLSGGSGEPTSSAQSAGPTQIDVLVVYTQAAANAVANINEWISMAVGQANQAYVNSGINQHVSLRGTRLTSYTSNGSTSVDLDLLRDKSDPYLPEVHGWRDALGADAVVLYAAGYVANASCGRAYIQEHVQSYIERDAFSVVDVSLGCANINTLAHELGHNMAGRHDWVQDATNNLPFTYNHGLVSVPGDFNTVMAYSNTSCPGQSCMPIPHFSNPDVSYVGQPTGVPEGSFQAADNRKTLNNTANNTSLFRAPRVGAINSCGGGYVKHGPLSSGFSQQLNCGDARTVTVGGSRVGVINNCRAAYVKEGALVWGFNQQLNCGDALAVTVSPERVAVINSCGSAYVKQGALTNPFNQQLNCGDARAVALGGSSLTQERLGVINGCGAAYVKLGALNSPFQQLLNCNDAVAIAVTDNRVGVINSCGAFYVKEGALTNPFQLQTGCGDTRAMDISGNRVAVINGCGSLYVKDGTLNAPFQQQTGCNDALAVDVSGDRVGLISSCGAAWVKEGPLSNGFTPQLNCGDGVSVSVAAF